MRRFHWNKHASIRWIPSAVAFSITIWFHNLIVLISLKLFALSSVQVLLFQYIRWLQWWIFHQRLLLLPLFPHICRSIFCFMIRNYTVSFGLCRCNRCRSYTLPFCLLVHIFHYLNYAGGREVGKQVYRKVYRTFLPNLHQLVVVMEDT